MGITCCSDGGRCHQHLASFTKDEIGCSPLVPDDGVRVGSPVAVAPAFPPKRGKPVPRCRESQRLAGLTWAGNESLAPPVSDSESAVSIPTSVLPYVPKLQTSEAKAVIRRFVKEMIAGKDVTVLAPSGDLNACSISLSRNLDTLKIRRGSACKSIAMKDVQEIHAGADVEGIITPLDELCATVILTSDNAISFRMVDIEARNTFIECMTAFANKQR